MLNTLHTQLTLDLRAFLNMYANRPAIPPGLLSGSITTPLPRIARTKQAREQLKQLIESKTPHTSPFPSLKNHPGGHIIWQLTEIHGNNIEASYTITI